MKNGKREDAGRSFGLFQPRDGANGTRQSFNNTQRKKSLMLSLQLGVIALGLVQDGDVEVGVFPEGEEVLACAKRRYETSSSLEWDAIKVPVGAFFAESVARAVGA